MRRIDPGRVYVATNGRWVKVGKTQQNVRRRIEQLNRPDCEYSLFGPWRYVAHVYSDRHSALEAAAHRKLRRKRVRRGVGSCREIFAVSVERAAMAIGHPDAQKLSGEAARLLLFLACVVAVLFLATLMGYLP